MEMKCLGKAHDDLAAKDVEILGVSADDVGTQERFLNTLSLPFRLLSDADCKIAKAYGVHVVVPGGGFAARSVFLIDKEGVIRHVDRDFECPEKLEGSSLWKAIEELVGKETDPVDALKDEPSPAREGKTLAARLVQAVLGEDIKALAKHLHRDFGARPGVPTAKQREWRNAFLDRHRELFREHDIDHRFAFDDVLDLRRVRVLEGDDGKSHAAAAMTADNRPLGLLWKDGDVLVIAKTKPATADGKRLFAAEWVLLARKQGDGLLLVAEATR